MSKLIAVPLFVRYIVNTPIGCHYIFRHIEVPFAFIDHTSCVRHCLPCVSYFQQLSVLKGGVEVDWRPVGRKYVLYDHATFNSYWFLLIER